MYTPVTTTFFEKGLKRASRRGKSLRKIKEVMALLCVGEPLPLKYRDHVLVGSYKNRRECHIEPNWLLIYKKDESQKEIIFECTGTHADLFR